MLAEAGTMAVISRIPVSVALSRFDPFSRLAASLRDSLAAGSRLCRASRNEMVVHRGDRPAGMYMVVEGCIKLFLMSSTGSEKIVRLAGPGDSFCEENLLGDQPQILAAQASCDSLILHLPRRALLEAMAIDAALARALMSRLSARMSELVAGMEQCIQRSSTQRVAHYLVEHADRGADGIEVRLSCDKQTVASQLNLTPETFSRVLNRLTREGFIVSHGRRAITLTDLPRLQRIAA
jgi:CRP-like cAMP-binding protein